MYHRQQNKCYPKGVYLPISKVDLILAVVNLLTHNSKSQICYCGQISLQSAAVNCSFSDTSGGTIYFAGDATCLFLITQRASQRMCEMVTPDFLYMISIFIN